MTPRSIRWRGSAPRSCPVELPPPLCRFYRSDRGRIIGAEGYFLVGHLVDDMTLPIDDAVRPPHRLGQRRLGARLPAGAQRARRGKAGICSSARRCRCTADVARAPGPPPFHWAREVDQTTTPAHFTRFVNALDLCALSLPERAHRDGVAIVFCKSSAAVTRRRLRCALDRRIKRPLTGTSAARRVLRRHEPQGFGLKKARPVIRMRFGAKPPSPPPSGGEGGPAQREGEVGRRRKNRRSPPPSPCPLPRPAGERIK